MDIWNLDRDFTGYYITDHLLISNNYHDLTTSWLDKYAKLINSPRADNDCCRHELQPIPDYLRWFKTDEAHYLPIEEVALLSGDWVDISAIFLLTKALEFCFTVVPNPPEHILKQISWLPWLSEKEVTEYKEKIEDQLNHQLKSDKKRKGGNARSLSQTHKNPNKKLCVGNPTFLPFVHSKNISL